jgi:protein-S-isoprenylcysteine O-methyltransferase Ste14
VRSSSSVKLLAQIPVSGDVLFRRRGLLPLLLLPLFLLGLIDARLPATLPAGARAWQLLSFVIALAGLAVRVAAVGTAPPGTSERSTTSPRASRLRTTGLYSVVRHPLYLGNTATAVGLACFTTTWYVPAIVVVLAMLYHERIAAREEVFLEQRFGAEFVGWADRVPAFLPHLSGYARGDTPFLWRRVVGREFHALFVIGAALFALDLARSALATGRLVFDPFWTGFFLLTAAIFIVCSLLKKHTNVLKLEEAREPHVPAVPRPD